MGGVRGASYRSVISQGLTDPNMFDRQSRKSGRFMRRSTLKDLNIRWWYWLVVLTFGVAGIGSFLAIHLEGRMSER